jgi:hypothetical protein
VPGADRDILDFRSERARHEQFLGRDDVLAALDAALEATRGWVLVTGQPGMGKSAILTRWLARAELDGRPAPHHFLAAQIERLYPAQTDPKDAKAVTTWANPDEAWTDVAAKGIRRALAEIRAGRN